MVQRVLLALLGLLLAIHASAYQFTKAQGSPAECAPSYLALDPDSGSLYVFSVVVQSQGVAHWATEYRFPIGARCAETRAALRMVLGQTSLAPGWAVTVGTCH